MGVRRENRSSVFAILENAQKVPNGLRFTCRRHLRTELHNKERQKQIKMH
jgi:hypothetical protein